MPFLSFITGDKTRNLRKAAYLGNLAKVRRLLRQGACVNQADGHLDALQCAARSGNVEVVKIILQAGANLDVGLDGNPLLDAASAGHKEIVATLIENNANLFAEKQGNTALHLAAQLGHLRVVEILIASCAGDQQLIHKQNWERKTPLHMAASNGHLLVVEELVRKGAQSCCQDMKLNAPLHVASMNGHLKVVQYLLALPGSGEVVCQENLAGRTPLHLACTFGHWEVAALLLGAPEVDVNAQDKDGNTAMHLVLQSFYMNQKEKMTLVTLLVESGASISIRNQSNESPVDLAQTAHFELEVHSMVPQPAARHKRISEFANAAATTATLLKAREQGGGPPSTYGNVLGPWQPTPALPPRPPISGLPLQKVRTSVFDRGVLEPRSLAACSMLNASMTDEILSPRVKDEGVMTKSLDMSLGQQVNPVPTQISSRLADETFASCQSLATRQNGKDLDRSSRGGANQLLGENGLDLSEASDDSPKIKTDIEM